MQVSFSGFQHELYGRTLVPYALRSENKKEAERLFASGEARAIAGKLRDAAEAYGESNASFATVAARVNQAVALFNSSALLQAEQILKSVLIQAENSENKLVKASILTNLGHIARIQGRFDEAEKAYMDALAIDRESGYKAGEAINLNNLGLVLLSRGSVVKSLGKFRDALSTSGEAGIDSCAASSRVNIASVLIAFGRGEEAEQQYLRPASIYLEKQGSALDKADEWTVTGNYLFQTGKYDQALNFFNAAIAFYESLSNKIGESSARLGKANVLGSNLQLDAVLEEYRKAFDLGKSLGDSSLEANALMGIGDYFAVTKHYAEAIVNYQRP